MTAEEFAKSIDGRSYPFRLSNEEAATAEASGLVVIYGASDDLVEFGGAIYDEIGAPRSGNSFLIDRHGPIPDWDEFEHDDEAEVRRYIVRKEHGRTITVFWCGEGREFTWEYETAIPHATFSIVEDGDKYCRGMVFSLEDL